MFSLKSITIAAGSAAMTAITILNLQANAQYNPDSQNLSVIASIPVIVQAPRNYDGSTASRICSDLGFDALVGEHFAAGGNTRLISCRMDAF